MLVALQHQDSSSDELVTHRGRPTLQSQNIILALYSTFHKCNKLDVY